MDKRDGVTPISPAERSIQIRELSRKSVEFSPDKEEERNKDLNRFTPDFKEEVKRPEKEDKPVAD